MSWKDRAVAIDKKRITNAIFILSLIRSKIKRMRKKSLSRVNIEVYYNV